MRRLAFILLLPALAFAADVFGPDLLVNGGFEEAAETGIPGWHVQARGSGTATVDSDVKLVGKRSLRVDGSGDAGVTVVSDRIPVTPGGTYLVSVSYRQEGWGTKEREEYHGISSFAAMQWLAADGRTLAGVSLSRFLYGPSPWDLRDLLVTAPDGAASAVVTFNYGNSSRRHEERDIPATMWIDGAQFRVYNAPPTPAAAFEPAKLIVEGGVMLDDIRTFFPAAEKNWHSRGGQWSAIELDAGAERGSVLTGLPGHGRGIMEHSPYFAALPPGVYRIIVRAKCEPGAKPAGLLDVGSRFAGTRLVVNIDGSAPADDTGFGRYQGDFIQRDDGWWCLRLYTEGERRFAVDSIRVVPLVPLPDRRLATVYPGIAGDVPDNLRPRTAGPTRVLVMAGLGYDWSRVVETCNLLSGATETVPAWVMRDRSFKVRGLPLTAAEFFDFNVIALCNIDSQGMSLAQRNWLRLYAERGGAVLLLGGHRMFERGHWHDSLLTDLLPFALGDGAAETHYAPDGLPLRLAADLPWLPEADTSADPLVYFLHPATPKPGAYVFATAGGYPALIGMDCGQGRVVAALAMPMGNPNDGALPFWDWPDWPYLLRNATWWATHHPNLR